MKFTIPVLLLAIMLAGCGTSSTGTEPPATKDELIPLSAGNKWIYLTTFIDPDGQILSSTLDSSFVGLSTNLIGKTWFFYDHKKTGSGDDISLFRNDNQGLYQFEETLQTEFLAFKYPAKAGEIYTLFSDPFSSLSSSIEVVSTDTLIVAEKETFKCYQYRPLFSERTRSTTDIFIAPNIGIIKEVEIGAVFPSEESPDQIFGVTRERVLVDFIIK